MCYDAVRRYVRPVTMLVHRQDFHGIRDAKLKFEQANRTKRPIAWKDGEAVRKISAKLKLKTIGDALDQHFFKHPYV